MRGRMLLYDNAASGNCYKVRLLASHLGLGLQRRELDVLDRSNRADVLGGLNPALRVPVLVLDDGRPLAESNAILYYLADGTEYFPSDSFERAQVVQWLMFEQYSHEPNIATPRFWLHFGIEVDRSVLAERQRLGNLALAALDQHLDGRLFLVGDRYSIADISLYAYTHVAHEGGFDLGRYASTRAWLARVEEQPGYVPITA
jgi:glutathione S-transferase